MSEKTALFSHFKIVYFWGIFTVILAVSPQPAVCLSLCHLHYLATAPSPSVMMHSAGRFSVPKDGSVGAIFIADSMQYPQRLAPIACLSTLISTHVGFFHA